MTYQLNGSGYGGQSFPVSVDSQGEAPTVKGVVLALWDHEDHGSDGYLSFDFQLSPWGSVVRKPEGVAIEISLDIETDSGRRLASDGITMQRGQHMPSTVQVGTGLDRRSIVRAVRATVRLA
jgi:hypothetical protein